MKKYEVMYIVRPNLSEDELAAVVKKFNDLLATKNSKVVNVTEMGQRELAYEIQKYRSGYYYVVDVEAKDDEAIKEFDRLALISGDIIRHLITNKED
jgi:small subunit ribosomal protein S6